MLDGSQRSALAITRSLGKRGVPVTTASERPSAICKYSKYSQQYVVYPDPKQRPDEFLQWFMDFISANRFSLAFAPTDITCNILANIQPKITNTLIPLADIGSIRDLSDKSKLTQAAARLGIPHPKTLYVNRIEDFAGVKHPISFPCVIKPSFSRYLASGQWIDTKVAIVKNEAEFDYQLNTHQYLRQQPFMIQEYIEGIGQGVFALYDHGNELAWFAHKRLREKPPWGGVSVLSESIALPKDMVDISRKILDDASWHGVAMVEFKVASDGTPYLMEVNTRFWGSLQLAIDAGVDFPYLLYLMAMGHEPEKQDSYYLGKRLRWLLGDLDSLLISLKNDNLKAREKVRCAANFIVPDFFNTKHEIDRISDLKPAFFEAWQYVYGIIKR